MAPEKIRNLLQRLLRRNPEDNGFSANWKEAIISEITFPIKFLSLIKCQNFELYGVANAGENPKSGRLSIYTFHSYGPDYKVIATKNLESLSEEKIKLIFPEVSVPGLNIYHSAEKTSHRIIIDINTNIPIHQFEPDKNEQIKIVMDFTNRFNALFKNAGVILSPFPPANLGI